jgi:hypothetical protein
MKTGWLMAESGWIFLSQLFIQGYLAFRKLALNKLISGSWFLEVKGQ